MARPALTFAPGGFLSICSRCSGGGLPQRVLKLCVALILGPYSRWMTGYFCVREVVKRD